MMTAVHNKCWYCWCTDGVQENYKNTGLSCLSHVTRHFLESLSTQVCLWEKWWGEDMREKASVFLCFTDIFWEEKNCKKVVQSLACCLECKAHARKKEI